MSDKSGALSLVAVMKAKGIRHVVLCPGSRNAPLIDAFTADDHFRCYSIVDERSAGFFALGISQTLRETVAVCCTSGSALLNLAPAVAEAYFQRVGLLVISADRPQEWVNQGESQTIRQSGIFENYIRGSFSLFQEPEKPDDFWYHERQINEAINLTRLPLPGPVHVNLPFREPLYGKQKTDTPSPKIFEEANTETSLSGKSLQVVNDIWRQSDRVLVICGQGQPDETLNENLSRLAAAGAVVLTETNSNLYHPSFFPCIDQLVIPRSELELEEMRPELLITFGGPLISRKVKGFLRKHKPVHHWHIDLLQPDQDAYQSLSLGIRLDPVQFFERLDTEVKKSQNYLSYWKALKSTAVEKHGAFLSSAPYSDLKVFETILKTLPEKAHLQIGNSSAIRYVQLIETTKHFRCYGNRGTSGIEGSLSTAVGAAAVSKDNVYHITGDLSLMYDSNGFWNNYVSNGLKVIVINNGGGGIFRIIDGPATIGKFEEFIETENHIDYSRLADLFGLKFFRAEDETSLKTNLKELINYKDGAALLEVKTPRLENDKVLTSYFNQLKTEP